MILIPIRAAEPHAWVFDATASHVDFAVRATGDSFVGHLNHWHAQFQAETNEPPTDGNLTFAVADLATGKRDRDEQMLAWLEAKRFPSATFVLKSMTPAGDHFEVSGDFTFHGVSRPISFPVRLVQAGTRRRVDGTAVLDYRDWNLKIFHKFLVLKVEPIVKVTFHFEADAG